MVYLLGARAGTPVGTGAPPKSLGASDASVVSTDADLCAALGSGDLSARTAAAKRLNAAHSRIAEGGTEQSLATAALWCAAVVRRPPSWWQPLDPNSAIARDVRTIVGGQFSVDHLGPAAFAALRSRAAQNPGEALDALDALVASSTPDALSVLWPSALLDITRPLAPDRTSASARLALAAFEAILARPSQTNGTSRDQRLRQRAAAIRFFVDP
jgi:hypothetical protein